MGKSKKYEHMAKCVLQFNRITGNLEWATAVKYLIHTKWNVNVSILEFLIRIDKWCLWVNYHEFCAFLLWHNSFTFKKN